MSFQESFNNNNNNNKNNNDDNNNNNNFYCAFFDCWQKKFSHNLNRKS